MQPILYCQTKINWAGWTKYSHHTELLINVSNPTCSSHTRVYTKEEELLQQMNLTLSWIVTVVQYGN